MPYYRICPYCHAYLDFGERCDCQDKETAQKAQHKKEPAVAATTTSSKAEQKSDQLNRSASIVSNK